MQKLDFNQDFLWGCATASYQVEGAIEEGGRKPSIWDTFCNTQGAVKNGDSGRFAADQYHLYKEDVKLIHQLGFQAYRFSIAWPRIIPDGTGEINQQGIEYYKNLCLELKKYGIKAVATLYHWDLPQVLQDDGGWDCRKTAFAFSDYAKACFEYLGAYVDQWITLNEPLCSSYLGYLNGVHAPGIQDAKQAFRAVHHLNLAHGLAVEEYRKLGLQAPIGITLNPAMPRPASRREQDIHASELARSLDTDVFLYPLIGRGYPALVTGELKISFPVEDGDYSIISQKIDFIGINYYSEYPVVYDESEPFKYKIVPSYQKTTDMGWPIVPYGLLRILHYFNELTNGLPLYITENGCATKDEVQEGRVHDFERCDYLKKHFEICKQAIDEGIPLKGYFVWSLMDNFEWAYGYSKRFGVVYIDYDTQQRIPKDSAYMIRDFIAGYCEI